ncbi:MAG: DUF4430 domain-containing protein [Candidatus Pacebacteria bacterium]|nr:DUF4430 domain-containing protein [Candidatus Paceibacterota bacterium]
MNRIIKSIIELVILAAVVAIGVYFYHGAPEPKPAREGSENEATSTESMGRILVPSSEKNAILFISFNADDFAYFEAEVKEWMTAFDLLKDGTSHLKLDLQTKDYGDMGVLVEKIGQKKNSDDGKYWLYYVNGQLAQVAANKQPLKAGDKVEWKFEKSSF